MAAVTRWVDYSVNETGVAGTGGGTVYGAGTPGYHFSGTTGDTFNIGTTNNRLYLTIDGGAIPYITLASGSDLDPRFVAKDIMEKIHNAGVTEGYTHAKCFWVNDDEKNPT